MGLGNLNFLETLAFLPIPKTHCAGCHGVAQIVAIEVDRDKEVSAWLGIAWRRKGEGVDFMLVVHQVDLLVCHQIIDNDHATYLIMGE